MLAVRHLDKGRAAAERITAATPGASVALQELDLGSLASIRCAADQLRSDYPAIDLLINNAGVGMPPKSSTKDGFESQFGINHLGHFALTILLLDRVVAALGSRVVTVSSQGHRFARSGIRFDDLQWDQSYSRAGAYGQSKLANLMFTYELQRRLQGTKTIAVAAHPGSSKTELDRNSSALIRLMFNAVGSLFHDADMAALPTLRAATDPGVLGGQYFGPDGLGEQRGHPKVVASSAASHDTAAQRRLWEVSEELTGVLPTSGIDKRGVRSV